MEEACQQSLAARSGCVRQATVHASTPPTQQTSALVFCRSEYAVGASTTMGEAWAALGGREVVVRRPTPPEDRPLGGTLTLGPHRQRAHGRLTSEGLPERRTGSAGREVRLGNG